MGARERARSVGAVGRGIAGVATLLGGLASFGVLVLAQPGPRDGVYEVRQSFADARPGAIIATRHGQDVPQWVKLGAKIRPRKLLLYSRDNANQVFSLDVWSARRGTCGDGALRLGGATHVAEAYGGDGTGCDVTILLSPAIASQVASTFRIPRQDRHPIGERVTGRFAPTKAVYARGEPVQIALTMSNPRDAAPVAWQSGGSWSAGRDNQFDFRIARDGRRVHRIDPQVFAGGGGFQFVALAPGRTARARAPVARWGDVTQPGHYVVRCTFKTTFTPDAEHVHDDDRRGAVWERTLAGTVRFEVQ